MVFSIFLGTINKFYVNNLSGILVIKMARNNWSKGILQSSASFLFWFHSIKTQKPYISEIDANKASSPAPALISAWFSTHFRAHHRCYPNHRVPSCYRVIVSHLVATNGRRRVGQRRAAHNNGANLQNCDGNRNSFILLMCHASARAALDGNARRPVQAMLHV